MGGPVWYPNTDLPMLVATSKRERDYRIAVPEESCGGAAVGFPAEASHAGCRQLPAIPRGTSACRGSSPIEPEWTVSQRVMMVPTLSLVRLLPISDMWRKYLFRNDIWIITGLGNGL